MANHTDLAKNLLTNTSQGKARSNQLWEQLASKLNASGPPVKDAKAWRKVYADQKQNVKKKIQFNKSSKKRTRGGPFEEKILSQVEEQIVAAAGLEASVDGLTIVKSFGFQSKTVEDIVSATTQENSRDISCTSLFSDDEEMPENISSLIENKDVGEKEKAVAKNAPPKIYKKERETKTILLKKNMMTTELYQKEMLKRLDKIIEIENKNLELKEKEVDISSQLLDLKIKIFKMKERGQNLSTQIKEMELQIRKKELEKLNMDILMD
ncbi:uncharacterized protein LOC135961261 [Calliphora vicina]|uniref:uncharacterized protein LOC135961261 n=1 Tax=Calliphora vicina TaxID=7373 RepID=UPI00325AF939